MTSHDLWLGVIFLGGVAGNSLINAIIKWLWELFIHRTQETIDIWWSHKKKSAERTLEEAARNIGGPAP